MDESVIVKVTSDYSQFTYLLENRPRNRGHIENLKKSFEEYGNFTRVQPILVNDHFQIIDGQHRFEASKELGQPIYYSVVPGLSVTEARAMNINHRGWTVDDYIASYIAGGNQEYAKYLQMKEEYGFPHSIMVPYIEGHHASKGLHKRFRNGEFVIDDYAGAKKRLDRLSELEDVVGALSHNRAFALAYLALLTNTEGFDHKRMVRKLESRLSTLKPYTNVPDTLRQFEDVYNYQMPEGSRQRLY